MKISIGDYLITSDNLQFIVNKKSIIQESRLTKAENVGNETIKPVAYCTKFEEALRFVPQDVLKSNDDINIIMDKLNEIKAIIEQIKEYPVIVVKEEKKFKFEDLKDGEIKEIEAEDEEKAWVELLGYHVCKYSEAVYVNEIKGIYWGLVVKEKPKVKIVSDEDMEELENE